MTSPHPSTSRSLRSIGRRARNLIRGDALILLYHRVTTIDSDPQCLCVSEHNFAAQMDALRKTGGMIPMTELAIAISRGKAMRGAIAITFDDGYADNLPAAKLLCDRSLPATFFLSTHFIASEHEMFWDELDRLLLSSPKLPSELFLEIAGKSYRWETGPEPEMPTASHWTILENTDPAPRHRIYRSVCDLLKPLDAQSRQAGLLTLRGQIGATAGPRATHRAMSWADVISMSALDGIEIGAHTRTHPMLSALDEPRQRDEIAGSIDDLKTCTGKPIAGFSYPFGGRGDYSDTTLKLAREYNLKYACANWPAVAGNSADLFALPRFVVRDWPADQFKQALFRWRSA